MLILVSLMFGFTIHAQSLPEVGRTDAFAVPIPLGQISELPLFGGYSNHDSDQNRLAYVETICRYLGYEGVYSAHTGWDSNRDVREVLVIDESLKPRTMRPDPSEQILVVTSLKCLHPALM